MGQLEKGQFLVPFQVEDGRVPEQFMLDLNDEVEGGWIKRQTNDDGSLAIYCYTHATQYAQRWNEITRQCRGLIIENETNRLIARPMQKFFNLAEHSASDVLFSSEVLWATEKVDGSLAISYVHDGKLKLATKGSFGSVQAVAANKILQEKYPEFVEKAESSPHLLQKFTHCFEVIYPENRIVTDYGGVEDLVYITSVRVADGHEGIYVGGHAWWPGPQTLVTEVKGVGDLKSIEIKPIWDGILYPEGLVLVFLHGEHGRGHLQRVKVKEEEYIRVHAFVSNISNRVIWNHLREEQPVEELLEPCPDEFYDFVKDTIAAFENDFDEFETKCYRILVDALEAVTGMNASSSPRAFELAKASARNKRKDFAALICRTFEREIQGAVFLMLDDNQEKLNRHIWNIIEPKEIVWPTGIQGEQ